MSKNKLEITPDRLTRRMKNDPEAFRKEVARIGSTNVSSGAMTEQQMVRPEMRRQACIDTIAKQTGPYADVINANAVCLVRATT